jgi:hypothetical protein
VRPLADVLGGGQADAQLVEEVDVEHYVSPLFPRKKMIRMLLRAVS